MAPEPFGPLSLTGLELELVAPRGLARGSLASALAAALGGTADCYLAPQRWTFDVGAQRVHCVDLTVAYRVSDRHGRWLALLRDDNSLEADLDPGAPASPGAWRLLVDEQSPLAAEPVMIPLSSNPAEQLELLLVQLGGAALAPELGSGVRPVLSRAGERLGVIVPYRGERERACELISRPLLRGERSATWAQLTAVAKELGFAPATDGGLHVHLDGAPWASPRRLCELITAWKRERQRLLAVLEPNPRTARYHLPLPNTLYAAAEQPGASLAELLAAGPLREAELNLLGVLGARAPHTLEVRCFALELDAARTFERLASLEGWLAEVAARADA